MEEHLTRFNLKMKVYKVECSSVYKCAMFQGYLKRHGIDAVVKQGFCVLGDNACRHFWVEDVADGTKLDVVAPTGLKTVLMETIGPDIKRIDEGNKLVSENELQYESFTKNPKQFWKDAPLSVKKFKH